MIPSASVAEAVLDRPHRRTVIKRGRVVARDGRLVKHTARLRPLTP